MGMCEKATALIFVLLLGVILLAMVGPCLVQDRTTGNAGGALDNIKESIENTNNALENGPVGEFFNNIDNGSN